MIPHAAGMAAFIVDTVSQAPTVVQCPQTAPESWLKWLLPTLVQTIVSLVSIGSGVGIAVWSFRRNRQSEHVQWVRDQKEAEWRAIIQSTADLENAIPAVSKIQDRYDSVSKCIPGMIARLLAARGSCVFIWDVLGRPESVAAFDDFIKVAASAAECLQGFNAQVETDQAVRLSCQRKYDEIREQFLKICSWVRAAAERDLKEFRLSS